MFTSGPVSLWNFENLLTSSAGGSLGTTIKKRSQCQRVTKGGTRDREGCEGEEWLRALGLQHSWGDTLVTEICSQHKMFSMGQR